MRHQGTVVLNVLISETGAVEQVEMIKGVGRDDMDREAIAAVRQWSFEPAQKDGVAVKVWKVERVVFKL